MRILIGSTVFAAATLALAGQASAATARACDRTCMIGIAEQYLAAFVAHDPSKAPIAPGTRYTETGIPMKVGEGLWKTVTARVPGGSYLVDLPMQTVIFLGALEAPRGVPPSGAGPLVSSCPAAAPAAGAAPRAAPPAPPAPTGPQYFNAVLRLKVVNRQITEIELLNPEIRDAEVAKGMTSQSKWWDAPIPVSARRTRAEMIAAADTYFQGALKADGKIVKITPDAFRFENGAQATSVKMEGPGAGPRSPLNIPDQFSTHVFDYIKNVTFRRWYVDEEHGIAHAFAMFDQPGWDANPAATPPLRCQPRRVSMLGETFKLENGLITHVQATGKFLPYGSTPGWPAP